MRLALTALRGIGSTVAPIVNIQAVREGVAAIWRNRRLCLELTRRDLGSQYAGQAIGRLWIVAHPLILFAVYIFLFTVVLRVKIAANLDMPRDYATYILSGLAPWLATQLVLSRATTALAGQANLVKQVVFPIEVLPVGVIIASGVPLLTGLVLLIGRMLLGGDAPWTLLLLPACILLHATFLLGVAYTLAAITPFFRDLKDMVAAFTVVGVYLIPAFYLPQWVPPGLRPWLYLNPFSYFIWIYQDCLYFGEIRHPEAWGVAAVLAFVCLAIGIRVFRKLKPYVANVL
ncbi:MAG: ABC transporter permease [Hyphomicrobiaceae bacterium]